MKRMLALQVKTGLVNRLGVRRLLVSLVAVLALAIPAGASAHATNYVWSAQDAQSVLLGNPVTSATCAGIGQGYTFAGYPDRYYEHFNCLLRITNGNRFALVFHVLGEGENDWAYSNLRYLGGDKIGGPPAGATAQCRDGTYSYSKSFSGTCSWHGGVLRWLVPHP